MPIRAVYPRQRDRPVVIKTTIGNARERYEAMQKGKPVPPKQTVKHDLPEDVLDTFLTELGKVLAREFKKDMEDGAV